MANEELTIRYYETVLDCDDPDALAKFYAALMKWEIMFKDDDYTCLGAPGQKHAAYPCLTIQRNPDYVPPVWPEQKGAQQQMAHLDFAVSDLKKAVEHAIACGAKVADDQFSDHWRVMRDPAGHPFCLCDFKQMMENREVGLL